MSLNPSHVWIEHKTYLHSYTCTLTINGHLNGCNNVNVKSRFTNQLQLLLLLQWLFTFKQALVVRNIFFKAYAYLHSYMHGVGYLSTIGDFWHVCDTRYVRKKAAAVLFFHIFFEKVFFKVLKNIFPLFMCVNKPELPIWAPEIHLKQISDEANICLSCSPAHKLHACIMYKSNTRTKNWSVFNMRPLFFAVVSSNPVLLLLPDSSSLRKK
jgi:hypothetical protein